MLKQTVLHSVHAELGGKLVDFGGWSMPLHYGSQMQEHHYVRQNCGMFDVSHMTVVDITGLQAKTFLQTLLANDVAKLKTEGKALYSAMLNEEGGVIDDLIAYLMPWGYRLVVNCATRDKDMAWINKLAANFDVIINEQPELGIIAVQGPDAIERITQILPLVADITLSHFQGVFICPLEAKIADADKTDNAWFVAKTGYTGEQGVEIILPNHDIEGLWRALLAVGVHACGLGARDTLRLEAGMNLYGHEMDEAVSPLEANMGWTIAWEPSDRNFIGRPALEQAKANQSHKLIGLVLNDKGILRAGQTVTCDNAQGMGTITSGSFSPTLGKSVALARVPVDFTGTCQVQIRKKLFDVNATKPMFVREGKAL